VGRRLTRVRKRRAAKDAGDDHARHNMLRYQTAWLLIGASAAAAAEQSREDAW